MNHVFPATIVDVSPGGVRIQIKQSAYLGAHCSISASLFPTDIRCRVVWRDGAELGLEFKPVAPHRRRPAVAPRSELADSDH